MVDGIADPLLDPFRYTFMVRALLVSVLVGVMCPVLGSYVVSKGLAFMGDAMAHAVLPGLVVGLVIGVSPFVGAVPVAIAMAVLIGYMSRRLGVSEDVSIGILFAGLFALGLVLLSVAEGLSVNLEDLLLGQVLGVSRVDVYVTAGLAALVLLVLYAFHKELVFSSFDWLGATVSGVPAGRMDYLLLVLLALVIVISIQAVGIILVMAMLVTPAATAYLLMRRFVPVMVVGAALGIAAAVAGLYLSYYLNIPSGAAMTLVATSVFAVVAAAKRRVA